LLAIGDADMTGITTCNAYNMYIIFSCLHVRATVRNGTEIGLLSLRLSVSQGVSLGDFLLAPACPIEKVTH